MTFSRHGPIVLLKKKKLTEKEKNRFLFLHNSVRNKCNKNIQKNSRLESRSTRAS